MQQTQEERLGIYKTQERYLKKRKKHTNNPNPSQRLVGLGGLFDCYIDEECYAHHQTISYSYPRLLKPIGPLPAGMFLAGIDICIEVYFEIVFWLYKDDVHVPEYIYLMKKHEGCDVGDDCNRLCMIMKLDVVCGGIYSTEVTYSHPWLKHYYDKAAEEAVRLFPNLDMVGK